MSNRWLRFGIAYSRWVPPPPLDCVSSNSSNVSSIAFAKLGRQRRLPSPSSPRLRTREPRSTRMSPRGSPSTSGRRACRVCSKSCGPRSSRSKPPAAAAGASLTEALDLTDRLAASDERAREHLEAGRRLLAGEIIFTEARDALDAMQQRLGAHPGADRRGCGRRAARDSAAIWRCSRWVPPASWRSRFSCSRSRRRAPSTACAPATSARRRFDERPTTSSRVPAVISRTPITPAAPAAAAASRLHGGADASHDSAPGAARGHHARQLPRAAIACSQAAAPNLAARRGGGVHGARASVAEH